MKILQNVVNGDYGDGNHSSLDHGNGRFAIPVR